MFLIQQYIYYKHIIAIKSLLCICFPPFILWLICLTRCQKCSFTFHVLDDHILEWVSMVVESEIFCHVWIILHIFFLVQKVLCPNNCDIHLWIIGILVQRCRFLTLPNMGVPSVFPPLISGEVLAILVSSLFQSPCYLDVTVAALCYFCALLPFLMDGSVMLLHFIHDWYVTLTHYSLG